MKDILMFTMASCPYCRQAHRWMDELLGENPDYAAIKITCIDEVEQPELADTYNYYYVPTFYVGDVKLHEGAATKEKIKAVFDAAL